MRTVRNKTRMKKIIVFRRPHLMVPSQRLLFLARLPSVNFDIDALTKIKD